MKRRIGAYSEIDSMFDSRRAMLSLIVTEDMASLSDDLRKQKGDALWDMHFDANYKTRRLDTFSFPSLGIDRAKFVERYNKRSVSDWLFMYPSSLKDKLVKVIIDQEQLVDRPINISGIDLTLNTFPYEFTEDMKEELLAYCKTAFKGLVDVKLIHHDPRSMTALYYKQFNYVFKYDLLLSEEYEAFSKSLKITPIPDTCVVVPDVLVEESEYFVGPIADRIFTASVLLGVAVKLVSIDHSFYDYAPLSET